MDVLIICLALFIAFLAYKMYYFGTKYQVIDKFSINNGEDLEYYFVLKQKNNKKSFKIKVNKDIYYSCNNDDCIIINDR